ncbi:uncharacterized protein LOC127702439 [Mytilus californianus]|uniref:uncharacterized protein LOC127702439 n=1 Tax=Mytilus californianus TaxID=6549 RepID=UPI002247003B|nr:uncharacterized protein LOC127702439 [Mytilus californianus]XP_052062599.1 uncharacterized protein LOC127702439 [Mytilus californianus]XP_052062600.1 uncharacterized protein LOC127702439 [Mytilus californianus]XP_052062601.1 uncharacterized protein LOC127702439 [Mytilus californianus]XP_052062602.1 uncharacterized protein LOC127702439 [Mytilus californianus]
MSQWLLKKKKKHLSKSTKIGKTDVKPTIELHPHTFKQNKSSFSQQKGQIQSRQCNHRKADDIYGFPVKDCKMEGRDSQGQGDKIYNEPWDIHCNVLNNDQMCCSVCLSKEFSYSNDGKRTRNTSVLETSATKSKSKPGIRDKVKNKTHKNERPGYLEDSDTGCEFSNSSDEESDYYEFLENIERRLKIDNSNCNPVIMPKWDSPFYEKGNQSRPVLRGNGFNARCADDVIYNSGSDHSSGFFETNSTTLTKYNSPNNDIVPKITSNTEDLDIFSFPVDEPENISQDLKPGKRNPGKVYQTGYGFKGNRLLGDLIQMNYEKQQLH